MNSSNLAGFTNIIRMAELHKKKIVIIGRDLLNYVNIAKQAGYITHERDIFCRIADINKVEDQDLIIVIAGLHAEPFLDLTKMAKKTHNLLQLKAEDNILIAADTYDEIESFVQKSLDTIARSNCSIQSLKINVPANAYQEDIKMLINLFEPRFIVPIKGEYRKLKALKDLALKVGYEEGNVVIINNGDILSIYDEYLGVNNSIRLSETYYSESEKGKIDPIILKDREVLADNGYVMIIMMVQKGTHKLLMPPEIISGGLIEFNNDKDIVEKCQKITMNEFSKDYSNKELVNKLKVKIARNLQSTIGKTPMILPVKIEINSEERNNGQKQSNKKQNEKK
jgi:ribonuclease J